LPIIETKSRNPLLANSSYIIERYG